MLTYADRCLIAYCCQTRHITYTAILLKLLIALAVLGVEAAHVAGEAADERAAFIRVREAHVGVPQQLVHLWRGLV